MNPSTSQQARGRKAKRVRKKAKAASRARAQAVAGEGGRLVARVVRLVLTGWRAAGVRIRRMFWKLLGVLRAAGARWTRGAVGVIEVALRAEVQAARATLASGISGAAHEAART